MFLSDELEKIFNETGCEKDLVIDLLECCLQTLIPLKQKMLITGDPQEMLSQIKRIDYTWREFCKKHSEFEPDGFRNAFLKMQKPELAEKLKREINW